MGQAADSKPRTGELERLEEAPEWAVWVRPALIGAGFVLGSSAWILGTDWLLRRWDMAESTRNLLESAKGAGYALVCGLLIFLLLLRLDSVDRRARRRIGEREKRYRALLETQSDLIVRWLPDTTLTFVNEPYREAFGRPGEQLEGHKWFEFAAPDRWPGIERYIRSLPALRPGAPARSEEGAALCADGSVRWHEWTDTPVFDESGRVVEVQSVGRDVTKRVEAQRALRESEERFHQLADSAPVLIWTVGEDGKATWFNRQWVEYTGRRMEQDLGDGWVGAVHPEDAARTLDGFRTSFARRERYRMDHRLRRADGVYRWFEEHGTPRFAEGGGFLGYVGMCVDVTERLETEQALRESGQLYRAVVEGQTEFIVRWKPDGTMTFINEAARRGLGVAGRPLIGQRWPEALIPAEFRAECEERVRMMRESARPGGPSAIYENPMTLPDGSIRQHQWVNTPVFDGAGALVEFLSVGRDITERVEVEAELKERKERLTLLAEGTNDAIWDWDLTTDELWWSDGVERLFGPLPDATGRTIEWWERSIHPEDRERVVGGLQRLFEGGTDAWASEYRFQRSDGAYAEVADRGRVMRDGSGKPVRMVGGMSDITDRKRAERELRESRNFIARVAETTPDILYVFDLALGKSIFVSDASERILGYAPRDLVGKEAGSAPLQVHPDDAGTFVARASRWQSAGDDDLSEFEYRMRTRDGEWRWLRSREMVFARDAHGKPTQVVGAASDVTEQKRAEERQKLMMRELDHRVKNNLATVLALIDTTARTAGTVAAFRETLRGRIESLTSVHALLARSRWRGVSVGDLARLVLSPFVPRGRDSVEVLGGEAAIAPSAASPLCMALHELATNAAKHGALSAPEGRVVVHAREKAGENGEAGLEIEWIESGGPPTSAPGRRGVGLSLIEGLARHELGGRAESAFLPGGVRWTFWLPLDRRAEMELSESEPPGAGRAGAPVPSPG